eukprot:310909_1
MYSNTNDRNRYGTLTSSYLQREGTRKDPFNMSFDKQFCECDCEYDSVRRCQKIIYTQTKKGCFNFVSLLIGIILSFIWGIIMGLTQFFMIWVVLPCLKLWSIYYTPSAAVVGDFMDAIFGKCLKNLSSKGTTVNVKSNGNGNNNDVEQINTINGPGTTTQPLN